MNNHKLLIISAAILLCFAVYTLMIAQPISIEKPKIAPENNEPRSLNQVDMLKLEENYIKETTALFSKIESLVADLENATNSPKSLKTPGDNPNDSLQGYKERLLELTVPQDYKPVHLELVLMLDQLKNYLDSGDRKIISECLDKVSQIKQANSWLSAI